MHCAYFKEESRHLKIFFEGYYEPSLIGGPIGAVQAYLSRSTLDDLLVSMVPPHLLHKLGIHSSRSIMERLEVVSYHSYE